MKKYGNFLFCFVLFCFSANLLECGLQVYQLSEEDEMVIPFLPFFFGIVFTVIGLSILYSKAKKLEFSKGKKVMLALISLAVFVGSFLLAQWWLPLFVSVMS